MKQKIDDEDDRIDKATEEIEAKKAREDREKEEKMQRTMAEATTHRKEQVCHWQGLQMAITCLFH